MVRAEARFVWSTSRAVSVSVAVRAEPAKEQRTHSLTALSQPRDSWVNVPVVNVPFRLIFALNPQRAGIYKNNLQPAQFFQFRFAVGSTF